MERIAVSPREDWEQTVESQGMHYHTLDDAPYWDESAYYKFTSQQIDVLEKATYALNDLCLAAVQHVINDYRTWFPRFAIPEPFWDYVLKSWRDDEITIYGRYDLAYDGQSPPKLLEFNADTPTALLEAAVIQWQWMKDLQATSSATLDQFNSIHERLIEAWRRYKPFVRGKLYFTGLKDVVEDYMTVSYLRDTAIQAGIETEYLNVEEIRWDQRRGQYVIGVGEPGKWGYHEDPIRNCFKLYPWEWLVREPFGAHLPAAETKWLEAPWKMLLSNKAILPVLWQLDPHSPHLLRSEFEPFGDTYVRKPILAREGACVSIVQGGQVVEETDGMEFYHEVPCVYQKYVPLPTFDGNHPVIGSWLVNGWACGIGIREDKNPITGNGSRFVPHVFSTWEPLFS